MRHCTVLTTGANSGVGLATVLELAARGHRSLGTVRSEAKAEAVAHAAAERGVSVETLLLDVTDAQACAEAIETVRPDALVNNAGYALFGALECVPDAEARALLETLVLAPMRLARLAIPYMRDRGWGRIVNVSSLFGLTAAPPLGWYVAAKHAIEGLSDVLRMEVARDGIDVVLVEPGGVRSSMLEDAARDAGRFGNGHYDALYRTVIDQLRRTDFLRSEPGSSARVIADAIAARQPRSRYLVGLDAQLIARLAPVVPDWMRDRVTRLVEGL